MCAHDWQPIPDWYARYRCTICRVIGCKFGVVVAKYGAHRSNEITPYRCEAHVGGAKCNHPAVHSSYAKRFRCAAHHTRAQVAAARRELAARKAAAQAADTTFQVVPAKVQVSLR
jgi:hypothetical protein